MKNLIRLIMNIIKSPVKTIKGPDIISYDKDAMLRLFLITSSIYFILPLLLRYRTTDIGGLLLLGFLGPIIMLLVYNLIAVLYYMFFKLFGKGIQANYDSIKTALYPIFLTMIIIHTFVIFITRVLPAASIVLQYAVSLWFYLMTFILLRYKLRQTIVRSIAISLIPLFIGIAFRLL